MEIDETTSANRTKSTTTYTFQRSTLVYFVGILFCSIVSAGLLILHFGTCTDEIQVKTQVCGKENVIPIFANFTSSFSNATTSNEIIESNSNSNAEINDSAIEGIRLPASMKPISYDLKILPFLSGDNFTFSGHVIIVLNISENCQNITLHLDDALTVRNDDVKVRKIEAANMTSSLTESPIEVDRIFRDNSNMKQFFVIVVKQILARKSLYEVEIKYSGILADDLKGFHRNAYKIGNVTK